MSGNVIEQAIRERQPKREINMASVWKAVRGSADDLRAAGLAVAVHNDYRKDGVRFTFWLMTWDTGQPPKRPVIRSFKGEGHTDAEALDQIRAQFAEVTDDHHHAPLCPANHYHGARAPTGPCSCGAVSMKIKMGGQS